MTYIVVGRDIPECCGDCPFMDEDPYFGTCTIKTEAEECPLVYVPDNHGKIIDADKIVNYIDNVAEAEFKIVKDGRSDHDHSIRLMANIVARSDVKRILKNMEPYVEKGR